MEKKVLILSSSPRRGGNSDTLCKRFFQGAVQAGHRVEKVFLADKLIRPCSGCGSCSLYGAPCPQKDDMAELLQKMIDAQVIVMATPVYFYTLCGQMKTFIDRCCARYQEIKDKRFYFILTAAETSKAAMQRTVEDFRGFLDCLENASEQEVIYGLGAWKKGEIRTNPAMEQAYRAGKDIR